MIKKIVIISITVLLSITVFVCSVVSQVNYYKFNPTLTDLLFGMTPQEYLNNRGKGTLLKDGYIFASVNSNDDLILLVSDDAKERWKKDTLNAFSAVTTYAYSGVEISDNYTKCTVVCCEENAEYQSTSLSICVSKCKAIQAIDGRKSEDIMVRCVVIDEITNQEVYDFVMPLEGEQFSIDASKFTSRTQGT